MKFKASFPILTTFEGNARALKHAAHCINAWLLYTFFDINGLDVNTKENHTNVAITQQIVIIFSFLSLLRVRVIYVLVA